MKDSSENIKCTVENCHYNDNNLCQAESIEVNAMGNGKAETCDGTSCSTFKNQNWQASV
jgi:Domain of Unknown Function (DUF1540).